VYENLTNFFVSDIVW